MSTEIVSDRQEVSSGQVTLRAARRGALWGLISAVLWIVLGIDSIVRPVQDDRREIFW